MSDWTPCITRILKVERHPNADNLSIATVLEDCKVIIKNNEFLEGQLVAFLPYDTIVPDTEYWHWLAKPLKRNKDGSILEPAPPVGQVKEKDRTIKARKLRGIFSDALVVSAPPDMQEGQCIIECFNLTKREYEEELAERTDAGNESAPKSFSLFKYDLGGFKKYASIFQEGEQVLITEKIEGENITFIYTEDRLWVRSRNYFKKKSEDSSWWDLPIRLNLEERLSKFPNLAFWGEVYGGVKGWKYDCPVVENKIQRRFRLFDIYNIKTKKFMEWNEVELIAKELELDLVPVLYKGSFKNNQSLKDLAEGPSTIGTCVREGIVIRSIPEQWNERIGRKIIKLKGEGYKLIKD